MSNLKRRTLSSIENLGLDEQTDNETFCYLEKFSGRVREFHKIS